MKSVGLSAALIAAMMAGGSGAKPHAPSAKGRKKARTRMPYTRKGEAERRRLQIERGQLRVENGLRRPS